LNNPIYHLASPDDSEKLEQTGSYSAPSLDTEGFIHCCTGDQLPGVIQRYYTDATKLVLFHINTKLLTAELVYENTVGGMEAFPHIYGEINAMIQDYFKTKLDSDIGQFDAEFLLEFFSAEIGVYYYNQAIADSHQLLHRQIGSVSQSILELEKWTPTER